MSRFTADPATGYNTAIAGSEAVLVGTNSTWANISHPELGSTDNISLAPSGGMNGETQDILIADSRTHSAGAVAIVAGDFYTGSVYPSSYQNALFLSDFGDNQLRVLRTNASGSLNSVAAVVEEPATIVIASIVAFSAPLTPASPGDQDSSAGEATIDEAFDAWAEDEFDFADTLLAID